MCPDKGDYNFRLQYLEKQLTDIGKASEEIEKLSYQLPPHERDFIRTNLLSYAYIIQELTLSCKYSVIARMAFAKNELNEYLFNLKTTQNAMPLVDKGMYINSFGK